MALNIAYEEVINLRNAVAGYSQDLTNKYVIPCSYAIENCGLTGSKLKQLQDTAANANAMLTSAINALGGMNGFEPGTIAGTIDEIAKDYAEYFEQQNFAKVQQDAAEAASKGFTSARTGRKND